MPQMIHYQDDLYYLNVLIKALHSGLSAELDPEFFQGRLAEDINFIGEAIIHFDELLAGNALLIDRAELLKSMERTARSFLSVIDRLSRHKYSRPDIVEDPSGRLLFLADRMKAIIAGLNSTLDSALAAQTGAELVSEDELSGLLTDEGGER
jgi:hypothetical protein